MESFYHFPCLEYFYKQTKKKCSDSYFIRECVIFGIKFNKSINVKTCHKQTRFLRFIFNNYL